MKKLSLGIAIQGCAASMFRSNVVPERSVPPTKSRGSGSAKRSVTSCVASGHAETAVGGAAALFAQFRKGCQHSMHRPPVIKPQFVFIEDQPSAAQPRTTCSTCNHRNVREMLYQSGAVRAPDSNHIAGPAAQPGVDSVDRQA